MKMGKGWEERMEGEGREAYNSSKAVWKSKKHKYLGQEWSLILSNKDILLQNPGTGGGGGGGGRVLNCSLWYKYAARKAVQRVLCMDQDLS